MMTTSLEDRAATTKMRRPVPRQPGRAATTIILIFSLFASGLLRQVATDRQAVLVNIRGTATARSTLGNMDSYALALLLGGLRGPLIMILWPAIENQKADQNLEDVDTMIEWVRLLQPEFDTVHIFQIWNKAYNISAMMASPANKYSVIMEALDYGHKVDQERPDDVNILGAMQNVYGGKLGSTNLPEFAFYGRQFRQESLTDANRLAVYPELAKHYSRLSKWEPLLDSDNNIRADLLTPVGQRPAEVPADAEWNDGSELQYLKAYAPFPYGMSPLAMSYNYAKRAEVCESAEGQKPLQLSVMVTDSQPPLQLKFWEEDDAKHGRTYESRAFGVAQTADLVLSEETLAMVKPDAKPTDRPAIDAALYYYANAARVSRDAIKEYERHLSKPEFSMRRPIYRSHIADMEAADAMDTADHDYLAAIISTDAAERKRLLTSAADNYHKAMIRRMRTVLEFYTEDAAIWATNPKIPGGSVMPPTGSPDPKHVQHDKERVFNLPEASVPDVYNKAVLAARALNLSEHTEDRQTYGLSVDHCQVRLALIQKVN